MDNNILIQSLVVLFLACLTAAKFEQIQKDNSQCRRSAVDYNVTLSKGGKSGKFYKLADINKIDDCISKCCGDQKCNIALMVKKTCYMVECYSKESCEVQQASKLALGTVLSVVKKKTSEINGNKTEAEPAVEENLAEEARSPYVKDDGMTTISAFGTGKYKRTKRSSDIIDLVVAVGCGTVAVAVGVAGVIMMTRRLIDNSKNSAA